MNAPDFFRQRNLCLADLLTRPASDAALADPNREILAHLLAGRMLGEGCLPAHLGLGEEGFARLCADYFPGWLLPMADGGAESIPEADDLRRLLSDHLATDLVSAPWMSEIVVTACAGSDHLWQDLGLPDRAWLSRLMQLNFPLLAAANSGDMKWKKFLYRQFCAREGIYVCPAPSCGECHDFARCFGPEN